MTEVCSDLATDRPYQVFIVLIPDFGERFEALLQRGPVWLIDRPGNSEAAEKFWAEHPGLIETEGLTTFRSGGEFTNEE